MGVHRACFFIARAGRAATPERNRSGNQPPILCILPLVAHQLASARKISVSLGRMPDFLIDHPAEGSDAERLRERRRDPPASGVVRTTEQPNSEAVCVEVHSTRLAELAKACGAALLSSFRCQNAKSQGCSTSCFKERSAPRTPRRRGAISAGRTASNGQTSCCRRSSTTAMNRLGSSCSSGV